ncbi:MAG: aspartate aminotransferase family protein [Pseudomonadota bacterium]|nr:aspartate aminotransferase family protein [Pseudomonadota bacterium]
MTSAVMSTYSPSEIAFERGKGVYMFTVDGRRILDFGSGIAVTSLGHSHPHLLEAIHKQVDKLLHCSNLYTIPGQERMAQRLVDSSFASSVFFCNSGAEAVECGLKLVRRYQVEAGHPEKYRIITCSGGFHGRTLATISAAKQEKHMQGFSPMLDGFDQVAYGNINELRAIITDATAGILVEPIQGEGGIHYAEPDYLRLLRVAADEFGLLLFFDEVQTGIGRTGKLFAYEWSGIEPDVVSLAKGLGGGFPVGACMANARTSSGMAPGSHGSTFGGNPVAMAATNAVLDVVLEDGFLAHVQEMGAYLKERLAVIAAKHPKILGAVRGKGLLVGIACHAHNLDLVKAMEAENVLVVPAGDNVVRFIPPLIVEKNEIDEAVDAFDRVAAVAEPSEGA